MSQLTVDIVARTQDVMRKLGATEKQIEAVNDAIRKTAPASAQATAAMNQTAAAATKAGNAARGSSQKFFQAGQAISDFSVAGIRGAANNLEFLALQLGVGGPLLLGIAAATSALVVFGDDILAALDPVGQKVKALREGLEEVFEVIETGGVNLFLFEDQIPAALAEAEAAVKATQDQIKDLLGITSGAPELAYLNREKIKAANDELAVALSLLERTQAKRDEFAKRDEAAAASRTLSGVAENEELAKTLRAELERIGLREELARITDEQLVQSTREGTLADLVLKLQEKAAKATRDQVSELERAQDKMRDIAAELERRRTGELSVLDRVRDQTAELQAQLGVVTRLNEARREQAERGTPQRAQAAGTQAAGFTDILQSLNAARQRAQEEQQASTIGPEFLRALPAGAEDDAASQASEQQRALQDEFSATIGLSQDLSAILQGGLSSGLTSVAAAFGEVAAGAASMNDIGKVGLSALGGMAVQVGESLIAFGTAGVALKAFVANPVGTIVAGAGLVALGAALQARVSGIAGGGGSYGGGLAGISSAGNGFGPGGIDDSSRNTPIGSGFERLPNGAVIPAGSYQPAPPVQAFQPLAPSGAHSFQLTGELVGEGETLRAIVRNTDKRVQSTRGVS